MLEDDKQLDLIGTVCFQYDNSWISKAIAYFCKSKYSHVFIIWGVYDGEILILESSLGGAYISNIKKYQHSNSIIKLYKPKIPIEIIQKAVRWTTKDIVGLIDYGYADLLGYFIRFIFGIKKNLINTGNVCSETVAACVNRYDIHTEMDIQNTTPKDLEWIEIDTNFEEVIL